MVDRDSIEKSLLMNVVKQQGWSLLVLNDITEEYFTPANKPLYNKIKTSVESNQYPTIQLLCFEFNIADDDLTSYLEITNIQELCDILRKEYVRDNIEYEVKTLNKYQNEFETDPSSYIQRIGNVYNSLKALGYTNKTVGMFDNIEEVLKLDPTDVISTGFKELDEILVGWKRGEELVTVVARTGQGKSWLGLKFALSAALQNERVGIYSGEMSLQQLQDRILCCAKQKYTWTKQDSINFIKEKQPFIKVLTQRELRRRANVNDIEEMIVKDKLTMVIIDQLSLMEDCTCKPGTPIRQQYGNISNDIFSLTSRYNLPIILLVQSNRQGSADNNGPQLEHVAESDAVAQNSTRVISMKNQDGIMTMNIVKNRYGKSDCMQKYEIDFGINKFKPVINPAIEVAKRNNAAGMLNGMSGFVRF